MRELKLPEKYNKIFPPKQLEQFEELLDDILTGKFKGGRIELCIDRKVDRIIQHKNFEK